MQILSKIKQPFWILVFLVGCCAMLLLISQLWFSYHLNKTPSLPHAFFAVHKASQPVIGEYAAIEWKGGGGYQKGDVFIKILGGVSGDTIEVRNRSVLINGQKLAEAKSHSLAGAPLQVIAAGTIPAGQVFVYTPHKDSFDSRYQMFGLVDEQQIIGKAHGFF